MSVLHNLQLAPASGTKKTLKDIGTFINTLALKGLIEPEFSIVTGPQDKIQNTSTWDFMNHEIKSPLSKISNLQAMDTVAPETLADGNYAFKVHLSRNNPAAAKLDVFLNSELQHFPVFICFLSPPINYTVTKEDPETDEFSETAVTDINCIIIADGRNTRSLWELGERPEVFPAFFEEVKRFMGDFAMGSFYS